MTVIFPTKQITTPKVQRDCVENYVVNLGIMYDAERRRINANGLLKLCGINSAGH